MYYTANCKLNLTMEVLGKRPDGYHNIRSIMQFLDFGDMLEVVPAERFSFWCSDPALQNEQNLAVRAYRLLEQQYSVQPVRIRLWKRVPAMSGMGGGSADAAAVLRAVNESSGLNLSQRRLMELGRILGADVPACVVGGTLLAQGIGEQIQPLRQVKPLWFVVIKPDCSFSTPEMYRRMDTSGTFAQAGKQQALLRAVSTGNAAETAAWFCNSFEAVVQAPEVVNAAKTLLLESGALAASMTGAGSAVFGIYASAAAAQKGYAQVQAAGAQVYLCRSQQQQERPIVSTIPLARQAMSSRP